MKYKWLIEIIYEEFDIILKLFKSEAKYQDFLQLVNNYRSDEGHPPNQKYFLSNLKISRIVLMRFMNELYEDFSWKISDEYFYPISETKTFLSVRGSGYGWYIDAKGLKHIPKVGEDFRIDFIRRPYGSGLCKVESINHTLSGGVHEVTINLVGKYK